MRSLAESWRDARAAVRRALLRLYDIDSTLSSAAAPLYSKALGVATPISRAVVRSLLRRIL